MFKQAVLVVSLLCIVNLYSAASIQTNNIIQNDDSLPTCHDVYTNIIGMVDSYTKFVAATPSKQSTWAEYKSKLNTLLGIDLDNRQQLRIRVCSMIQAESVDDLLDQFPNLPSSLRSQLRVAYTEIRDEMRYQNMEDNRWRDRRIYESQNDFLDQTGFPEFPIKIKSASEAKELLLALGLETTGRQMTASFFTFPFMTPSKVNLYAQALVEADTLADFGAITRTGFYVDEYRTIKSRVKYGQELMEQIWSLTDDLEELHLLDLP